MTLFEPPAYAVNRKYQGKVDNGIKKPDSRSVRKIRPAAAKAYMVYIG